jgi:transposase
MDAHFPTQHLSAKLAVALKPLDYKKGYPKMKITTIGMDLAKTVFQIHGVDEHGKVAVRKKLKRAEVLNYYANLPSCLIGMKACGGAHYWARKLQAYGHTVKLMAPQVRKALCQDQQERHGRCGSDLRSGEPEHMRFVPIKNIEQQALLWTI